MRFISFGLVPAMLAIACGVDSLSSEGSSGVVGQPTTGNGPQMVTSLTPGIGIGHDEIAVGHTTIATQDASNIIFWDRYGNQLGAANATTLFQTFWKGSSPQNLNAHLPIPNSGTEPYKNCVIGKYGLAPNGDAQPDPPTESHFLSSCLTNTVYDMHTTYDPVHRRYIIAAHIRNMIWPYPQESCLASNFPNGVIPAGCVYSPGSGADAYAWRFLLIAVSKAEDPTRINPSDITQGFNFYAAPELCTDFPRIAVSGNYLVETYHGETSKPDIGKPLVTLWDLEDLAAGVATPRKFGYTQTQLSNGIGSPSPLPWTSNDFQDPQSGQVHVGFLPVPTHDPVPAEYSGVGTGKAANAPYFGSAYVMSRSSNTAHELPRLFGFLPNADRNVAPQVTEISMPDGTGAIRSYVDSDPNAASIRGGFLYVVRQTDNDITKIVIDQMRLETDLSTKRLQLHEESSTIIPGGSTRRYFDPLIEVAANGSAVVGYSVWDTSDNSFSLRSTTVTANNTLLPEHTWATGPNPYDPTCKAPSNCVQSLDPYVPFNRISVDPLKPQSVWILGAVGQSAGNAGVGGSWYVQAQSVNVPDSGCASGAATDLFYNGVRGCGGKVTWDKRATLCGSGYTVCTAKQWMKSGATPPAGTQGPTLQPTANYWTDDNLGYKGSGPNACAASSSSSFAGNCGSTSVIENGLTTAVPTPMHVCAPTSGNDAFGNHCNWTGCGLETISPAGSFGGCVGNTTAGALCCPVSAGCANGLPDDVFPDSVVDEYGQARLGDVKMVGCGGHVTWDQRAALCGPGYSPCKATQWANAVTSWQGTSHVPQPSANYWTDDNLGYTGSPYCEATTTNQGNCSVGRTLQTPMRVCTPSGNDAYGNQCNWTGCGLDTPTNQWFGGCGGNTYAGTLCCAN